MPTPSSSMLASGDGGCSSWNGVMSMTEYGFTLVGTTSFVGSASGAGSAPVPFPGGQRETS